MAGCGQFSSLFFLRPTSCATMRPPPKNRMAPVEEDLKALGIAQMEARHGDVPAESNDGAGE